MLLTMIILGLLSGLLLGCYICVSIRRYVRTTILEAVKLETDFPKAQKSTSR